MPKETGIFRSYIKIKALAGAEYALFKLLKEELKLKDMQEVFIIGLKLIHFMLHSSINRQVLINIINDWRENGEKERWYELPKL